MNMKVKITAVISFLGGIGWGLFGLYAIYDDDHIREFEFFVYFALMASTISTVLYVLWTRFGNKTFSDLQKMRYENQRLKLQIQQNKLKKKLED